MNNNTKKQMGSPSRDLFKYLHKNILDNSCYALNSDLELVDKFPFPFIVARLDFKQKGDTISFTEGISYNYLISMPIPWRIPVFIVEAYRPFDKVDEFKKHRFDIWEYCGANWKPQKPVLNIKCILNQISWEQFALWEKELRFNRRKEIIGEDKLKILMSWTGMKIIKRFLNEQLITIVLMPNIEGGFVVQCQEIPAAISQAETEAKALDNIIEVLEEHFEYVANQNGH